MNTIARISLISTLAAALGCEAPPSNTEIKKQNAILTTHWQLFVGEQLTGGMDLWNNGYDLEMQYDCNLVLYDLLDHNNCAAAPPGRVMWATGTNGQGPDESCHLDMQSDGNLVLYTENMRPLWSTRSNGSGADHFDLQTDGNAVVYQGGRAVWDSRTWHANPGGPPRECTNPTSGAVSADVFGQVANELSCLNSPVVFTVDGGSGQSATGSLGSGPTPPGVTPCHWSTFWFSIPNGAHTICANFPQGSAQGKVCGTTTVTGGNTSVVHL